MPSEKRKIGDIGEAVAARFLVKRGYEVVQKNYLKKWGEIDIIAKNNDILHFVEVKTLQARLNGQAKQLRVSREPFSRSGSRETSYNPAENVHPKKLERMHRTLLSYLEENEISHETEWQIDVIVVLLDIENKRAEVDFLENVV